MGKNIKIILEYPKNIYRIFFIIQFCLLLSHGMHDYYFSDYDIILDIIILLLLQSILLFITLSQNHNNYSFYKLSLYLSFFYSCAIVYSILVYIFCLIIEKEMFCVKCIKKNKDIRLAILLLIIKGIELIPFLVVIIYNKKIKKITSKNEINLNIIQNDEILEESNTSLLD